MKIPLPDGESVTLTRRQLIVGAVGAGALAVAGVAAAAVSSEKKSEGQVNAISVAEDAVFSLSDCTTLDAAPFTLVREVTMPYGTLVWANCDTYAACLLPTEEGSPITQVGIMALSDGSYQVALEGPASSERGFDIYDVRCSEQGLVWVEANCYTGAWRVYAATHTRGVAGKAVLLEEGDSEWEIPSIAAAGSRAFWQVIPDADGDYSSSSSVLKSAAFGSSETRTDWESDGSMACAPYSTGDAIAIAPRSSVSSSYYQLTLLDAESGAMRESLTLPASMEPLEIGYAGGRFSFTFDSIYTYGEGLGSLGTYTPTAQGNAGGSWFCFDRNPLCSPAWCGGYFIVKSTRSVAGVNLSDRTVFSLDYPSDCDDYGDFLASSGDVNTLVTYLGMSNDENNEYTSVRIWTA